MLRPPAADALTPALQLVAEPLYVCGICARVYVRVRVWTLARTRTYTYLLILTALGVPSAELISVANADVSEVKCGVMAVY